MKIQTPVASRAFKMNMTPNVPNRMPVPHVKAANNTPEHMNVISGQSLDLKPSIGQEYASEMECLEVV